MKKNILITGASGFIASHLSDYLSKKKFHIILFDIKKSPFQKKGQIMKIGNINNIKHLNRVTKNIDTVFILRQQQTSKQTINILTKIIF